MRHQYISEEDLNLLLEAVECAAYDAKESFESRLRYQELLYKLEDGVYMVLEQKDTP